jgi:hypothetical protein
MRLLFGEGIVVADRYCGNCGHELRQDDRFCPNCGRAVHEVAQVPTPEADVPVPPPPRQDDQTGAAQAEAPREGLRQRNPVLFDSVVVVGMFVVLIAIGAALSGGGETAGGGSGGGGNSGESGDQSSNQPPERAQGSSEMFTAENYPELVADPEAHEGAKVDVTGQIFTAPEIVEGDSAFQLYADPENLEWNTAVLVEGSATDLEVDDYVHVVGTVAGEMEGENLMGGPSGRPCCRPTKWTW